MPGSTASACQFVALFGSTENHALCPCASTIEALPLTVQVVGVTVTVVLEALVAFTSLKPHKETPSVVAVGSVTATDTEPIYSTLRGEQSAATMVSELVTPVMARPFC